MKVYVDPYINRNTGVLKNLLGISDKAKLQEAETQFTGLAMQELAKNPIKGKFDFVHLCKIHEAIFKDVYEWAGSPRIINIEKPELALRGISLEYSHYDEIQRKASMILTKMNAVDWNKLTLDEKAVELSKYMADLWKVHPFREGNTRTTVAFCCDFAESRGFRLDRNLFKDNGEYVRTALVAASADFTNSEKYSYLGDKSQPEHLLKIIKDGLKQGQKQRQQTMGIENWKKQIAEKKNSLSSNPEKQSANKNRKVR